MKTRKFNNEATQDQIADMAAAFNPFGWLDLKSAVGHALNVNEDADWAAEQVKKFAESTDSKIEDCDPVYCVLDSILQHARNEVNELTDFDIQNDASFDTHSNYCASSFDWSEKSKGDLIYILSKNKIVIDNLNIKTQYFLAEVGIYQGEINAHIELQENN